MEETNLGIPLEMTPIIRLALMTTLGQISNRRLLWWRRRLESE
jgi:hypothetical protein